MVPIAAVTLMVSCSPSDDTTAPAPRSFSESTKTGSVALVVVGDYFHPAFGTELVQGLHGLDARRTIVLCAPRFEEPLKRLFRANDVRGCEFHVFESGASILREWARDVAIMGSSGDGPVIVVSPDKHATSEGGVDEIAGVLRTVLDADVRVEVAPFVFEGGNLAFVTSGARRVLLMGKKVLFDNAEYQLRPWAKGLSEEELIRAVARTFGVDSVVVVGRARERPQGRLYLEYHIDMGMNVLGNNNAVVSDLTFGDAERTLLAAAIEADAPVISPFVGYASGPIELAALLADRLSVVQAEYDDYARVLMSFGVRVHRARVTWMDVLASESATNIVQAGNRILVPVFPDTLRGRVARIGGDAGHITQSLDMSHIGAERFLLEGRNRHNVSLYEGLGYRVVPVDEYLHYYAGGLHCFFNVLE